MDHAAGIHLIRNWFNFTLLIHCFNNIMFTILSVIEYTLLSVMNWQLSGLMLEGLQVSWGAISINVWHSVTKLNIFITIY